MLLIMLNIMHECPYAHSRDRSVLRCSTHQVSRFDTAVRQVKLQAGCPLRSHTPILDKGHRYQQRLLGRLVPMVSRHLLVVQSAIPTRRLGASLTTTHHSELFNKRDN